VTFAVTIHYSLFATSIGYLVYFGFDRPTWAVQSSLEARRAAQTSWYAVSQNWSCFGVQNSVWGFVAVTRRLTGWERFRYIVVSMRKRTGRGLRLAPSASVLYYVWLSQVIVLVVRALQAG
jgi:hypothetical protein